MSKSRQVQGDIYSLSSPAKVNIGLSLVGRRPNGYHEIESLFWPIDLCDELTISKSERISVEVKWSDERAFAGVQLPVQNENVVFKAMSILNLPQPFFVRIEKKIPIGGGLGGGSSNAGTFLRFLLEEKYISRAQAEETAVKLGADVPFFLNRRPSWVTGIGEKRVFLEETELKHCAFLLVIFPFGCNTAQIFREFHERNLPFSCPQNAPESLLSFMQAARNDLEPIASSLHPEIQQVLQGLQSTAPLYSGLSGSGSTCFAIYRDAPTRENAYQVLLPLCRKLSCRSIRAATYKESNNGNHRSKSIPGK